MKSGVGELRGLFSGKEKCYHYWPRDSEPITAANMTVQMTSESSLPKWVIREFTLTQVSGARLPTSTESSRQSA